MTDRVKGSLFNILGSRLGMPGALPDVDVLDLFAGSGALGIESMSRGAGSCRFVESDRRSMSTLRANLAKVGLRENVYLSNDNAWTMRFAPPPGGYGLVFVDPPYREVEKPVRVLDLLERLSPALGDAGVVVFRYSSHTSFPEDGIRALRCVDAREFGRMRVLLFGRS
jgi:16S rRNA (guanine966-N2)-methyltransferase